MIARYARAELRALWSDERRLESWLEVELAALDAWSELGVVPAEAVEAIRARAHVDVDRVKEIERRTHHDVLAFTETIAEQVGPEARWFHYGLTSSDVVDTALALVMRESGELLLAGIDRALDAVRVRAEEYRHTPCMGRTHGVHAEPTTFGLKLLGWWFELDRDRRRLADALQGVCVGKLSGAVGAYGNVDPRVETIALERLGLDVEPAATQVVARDRHALFLATLAVIAGGLDRFAVEIRHLQRSEVREAGEPFAIGQKGSSAMPHKRNPIICERISGLARVVRANAVVGFENQPLWHERDISHSSAERVVLVDSTTLLDYLLDRFTWVVEGMQVYPERMLRNLEGSFGLTFSGRVLLALVESGLSRERAYELVQRNAMRAWEDELPLADLLAVDADVTAALSPDELARAFDLDDALKHADVAFGRFEEQGRGERACLSFTHLGSGKVRELYDAGDGQLLLVASDRISAFDVVLPTPIPHKGRVLTGISEFWFAQTASIVPNHLISLRLDDVPGTDHDPDLRGRIMLVRRLEMLPVEFVVRGYLAGSGYLDYETTGAISGVALPPGLRLADRLAEPVVTPAFKATSGHDSNITAEEARALCGGEPYDRAAAAALAVYLFAAEHARDRGIVLADTKFEFGLDQQGEVVLGDEVLTPDSSRFWPAESVVPGTSPPSFDKQYVRDWLLQQPWDKSYPGPVLPREVADGTSERYRAAYDQLADRPFSAYLAEQGVECA